MAYLKPDSDETYKIEDEMGKRGNGRKRIEAFANAKLLVPRCKREIEGQFQ
jgi:hypothetical protein